MAQAMVNFRLDEDIKNGIEKVCKELGIPFALKVNPFYSESNMRKFERMIKY